jgi:hypothetical protein
MQMGQDSLLNRACHVEVLFKSYLAPDLTLIFNKLSVFDSNPALTLDSSQSVASGNRSEPWSF